MRLPPDFDPRSVAGFYEDALGQEQPIDPTALFARPQPIELEVGFGKGRFLVSAAEAWPGINFLGIELREKSALFTAWRAARRELPNLRVLRGDACALLAEWLPENTFSAIHFYFPDPWWKKRHEKRRIYRAELFLDFARALVPGGKLYLASDVPHVFESLITEARGAPGLSELEDARVPLAVTTNFEDKAARDGRQVQRAAFCRTGTPPPRERVAPETGVGRVFLRRPGDHRLGHDDHIPRTPMIQDLLRRLQLAPVNEGAHDGAEALRSQGVEEIVSTSPRDGAPIAKVRLANADMYERVVAGAEAAFQRWREMPAPRRGEVVRQMAEELRRHKDDLGLLVSLEMGKIKTEGLGEVQEMIDIADFAVGLSRQLYGLSMHSERPGHRMYEQWHPLGIVGIITAFNFPVAVWAWNAMIAAVCGDTMIWKPSLKTPLSAIAVQNIIAPVVKAHGLEGVFSMVIGKDQEVGERMLADARLPLISATGSTRMGRRVAEVVGRRLGRSLLELGGNNGIIVMDDADLDLVVRGTVFGAVGTAGQRCTTTRRLFLHEKIHDQVLERMVKAYRTIRIGDPLEADTLMGPLIDEDAVRLYEKALEKVRAEGGEIVIGGQRIQGPGHFVQPTIVKAHKGMGIVREETFAPILYVFKIASYEEALALHNAVDQGLSSSIFTRDLLTAERFLSAAGSDCGIANVNIGTSGAEIGGAFGGEKDTGGGREAGSDSWKAYMRRQTNTINYTKSLPLAQGVRFDI